MRRVTFGDLDVLLAHTSLGIAAVDDRCPHMAAPLSIGELDGCVVACPLHRGRFDLATGDSSTMPTTGGLWPDGTLRAGLVPARPGAEGGPARAQDRGAPPDPDPAASATTRCGSWTA